MTRNRNALHSNFETLRLASAFRGNDRSQVKAISPAEQLTAIAWMRLEQIRGSLIFGQAVRTAR
ncbi:hypothetical protein ACQ3G6_11705 [Allorhizobium undicola]